MSTSSLRDLGSDLLAALMRVLDRIAGGIAGGIASACAVLGIGMAGCADAPAAPAPTVVATAPVIAPVVAPEPPKDLGEFHVTFYYMIGEDEAELVTKQKRARTAARKAARSGGAADTTVMASIDPAAATAAPLVTLYNGKGCSPIADVTESFADQLALQGTGKLRDGRVVNVWGKCKCGDARRCFKVTGRKWGNSGTGRPLEPFRTVAVDPKQVKLGSLLYLPALDGMTMPGRGPIGGFKHDGCVAADDTGGGIDGRQLDLFVGRRAFYIGLARRRGGSHRWAKQVKVLDGKGRCERKGGHVQRVATGSI
jgi:3D (Asp-Asp-Asp) domain-containing protein